MSSKTKPRIIAQDLDHNWNSRVVDSLGRLVPQTLSKLISLFIITYSLFNILAKKKKLKKQNVLILVIGVIVIHLNMRVHILE